jgi:hypothetical protein
MSAPAKSESAKAKTDNLMDSPSAAPETSAGAPAYFHLLWDHELDSLAAILDSILSRRG